MAERDIIINAKINTGDSAKNIESVSKASGDFSTRLEKLNKDVNSGELTIRQLQQSVKQYREIALQAGADSPIGKQAIADAAVLQDRLDSVSTRVSQLSKDGANMKAALTLGEGVLAGYQGFLSVTTLMGVENEELIQTLTKLQAAQGAVNALAAIRNALDKDSVLLLKAQAIGSTALAGAQGLLAKAIGSATGATKLFRIALIATGIGAIVVGIGLLIGNFEKLTGFVRKAVDQFNSLGKGVKIALSIIFPFVGVIWGAIEALKAFGVIESDSAKQTREAEEKKRAEFEKTVAEQKKQLEEFKRIKNEEIALSNEKIAQLQFEVRKRQALGQDIVELSREILHEQIENAKRQIEVEQAVTQQLQLEMEARSKIRSRNAVVDLGIQKAYEFNIVKSNENIAQSISALTKLEQDLTVFELQQQKKRIDNAKNAAAERKRIEDEIRANELRAYNDFLIEFEKLQNEFFDKQLDDIDRELNAVEDKYFKLIEQAKQYEKDLDEIQILEDARLQAKEEIRAKYRAIELEEERKRQAEIDKINQEQEEAEKKRRDDEKAAMLALQEFRISSTLGTLQSIMNVTKAFEKDNEKSRRNTFNANKALGIAQGLVSTYQSALGAYASQLIPGDPTSIVRAQIAAGFATVFGLSNVASIAAQRYQSSGGGSSGGGGGSASAPTLSSGSTFASDVNLFGQANQSDIFLQDELGGQLGQQNKVVVVADEMSAVQQDNSLIIERSTL